VAAAIDRGSLRILSSNAAYNVRGDFDPEETMQVFSNAIEEALSHGFSGFRAAANMSWALTLENGADRLMTYEALLRSLFSTARATGLCLYDRSRMPLQVIDGALSTHPVVRAHGSYGPSEFYDPEVRTVPTEADAARADKLARLEGTRRDRKRHA
jgi:MEDS: MEthanogen/methylotroph, DcmR Sensory domain